MKRAAGLITVLIIVSVVACKSGKKYKEIKEFINEVVTTQDQFLSKIDKSIKTEEIVEAVDTFGTELVRLSGKSMELKSRYPEIEKWVGEPPEELKTDFDRLNDTESKFRKVFFGEKIKLLIRDKKIQDAFKELNRKLENVKFF